MNKFMARYVLYGSPDQVRLVSTESTKSNSFNISRQLSNYPNIKKPLTPSTLDKQTIKSAPDNAYIDYLFNNNESLYNIRNKLHKSLNLTEIGAQGTFTKYTKYYNRFKLPTVNDAFQKGFAHVFFTRPDCNLISSNGKLLNESFESDPEVVYTWNNNNNVIKQLILENGQDHHFMLSLSNKACSFSLSDEYINTESYGKTYKGWSVAYGRNNVESRAVGDFSITYNDDRTLHLYNLHRIWVDYISEVYQGRKAPKTKYIKQRRLDYASSCYYIITAEDGETIIFWSKYYGVFPTTIPSTQMSWAQGNIIEKPQLDIKYQFSFKEDMNPEALVEFNYNAGLTENMQYVPVYDPKLGHAGTSWVGAPFIELITDNSDPECPYTFKLRFRPQS